jgi:hypothetical protein
MTQAPDRSIKKEKKLLSLSLFVVMIVVVVSLFVALVEPESAGIEREIKKHAETLDEPRFLSDPGYQNRFESEAAALRFRLAHAYNGERAPDRALDILERLIKESERPRAISGKGVPPDSAALEMEAYYWEEMANSFKLKNRAAEMENALENRNRLRQQAKAAARKEAAEGGHPDSK